MSTTCEPSLAPSSLRDAPLTDALGRVHSDLRISITDRCNLRCFYCMPAEHVEFMPRQELLTFTEIERFVRVVVRAGVNKLRITGGEPLVRPRLPELIARLSAVPGVTDLALTTNGLLLAQLAQPLRDAGLARINVSLDTLDPVTFRRIARRDGLDQVLEGIFAARRARFRKIRLNAVAIRNLTEADIVPLGRFARQHDLEMRFIEFMPLDAEGRWQTDQVLSGSAIRQLLEQAFGPLIPCPAPTPSQPAVDFAFADGVGRIGFINPVSQPFCGACNRLRLTAEGQVRNCLFSTAEWDARRLLRGAGSDDEIAQLVRDCVQAKEPGHQINTDGFARPPRAMYQIGG